MGVHVGGGKLSRILVGICALVFATSANAHEHGGDFPATDAVRVEIRGVIEPHCALSWQDARTSLELGILNDAAGGRVGGGDGRLAFDVNCNHPFKYLISAENGALTSDFVGGADDHFARAIAYRASLDVSGAQASGPPCEGAALVQGCEVVSPGATTRARGELRISWSPEQRPLLSGGYHDRIRIVLTPDLEGNESD